VRDRQPDIKADQKHRHDEMIEHLGPDHAPESPSCKAELLSNIHGLSGRSIDAVVDVANLSLQPVVLTGEAAMSISKRSAVIKAFGPIPLDAGMLNWFYARRHLATVQDGKWRELAYIVELDELEQTIWKALARIRKRDGAKIAKEVAGRLADSIAQVNGAPPNL